MAIEIRSDDVRTKAAVSPIDDPTTAAALDAERALIATLGGGCQLPVGALAKRSGEVMTLDAIVASLDGRVALRAHERGVVNDPRALGEAAARKLIDEGAEDLLRQAAHGEPPHADH